MAGLLSGLAGLGLDNLENMDIYDTGKKEGEGENAQAAPVVEEKDLVYDKTFSCPVCDKSFSAKIMKTGKAKLLGTDPDLRPKYDGIDAVKYDVILCPSCGYTALTRFFNNLTSGQAKLIQEHISKNVRLTPYTDDTYSYDQALERYKLALANAVVKKCRVSEKAFICLKSAWLLRGYGEQLTEEGAAQEKIDEIKAAEEEYLLNAFNGFTEAVSQESMPMCGMDQTTIDFLLAELALHFKKFDVAGKLVASILTNPSANTRTKDKARDLKDEILAQLKKS